VPDYPLPYGTRRAVFRILIANKTVSAGRQARFPFRQSSILILCVGIRALGLARMAL
jgi:hypothetical protein